jgi:hypothetical protein
MQASRSSAVGGVRIQHDAAQEEWRRDPRERILADWKGIIDQFEEQQQDNPGGSLDIDRDMDAMLSSKYAMTVIFRSQDDAERAGPVLLDIPGVVNVRFGGKTLDSDPA